MGFYMLELIVLGQIPGTTIQLSVSTILYMTSCVSLITALCMYVSDYSRQLFELRQHMQAIELLSL